MRAWGAGEGAGSGLQGAWAARGPPLPRLLVHARERACGRGVAPAGLRHTASGSTRPSCCRSTLGRHGGSGLGGCGWGEGGGGRQVVGAAPARPTPCPVPACSNRIMDPEVPQALRLQVGCMHACSARVWGWTAHRRTRSLLCPPPARQAILVGGVVIVYSRQQALLLDDCRDMLVGSAWLGGGRARSGARAVGEPVMRPPSHAGCRRA